MFYHLNPWSKKWGPLQTSQCPLGSALRYHSCAQAPSNTIRSFPPCLDERLTEAPHSLPASSRPHPVSCHLSSHSTLELLAPIQIQIRELPAEVDSVSETATNGPAFALPFQGQETGAKTVSPNTASRSRALNRCAQSSRSTAFENTHPAVCSADLASSRNTASISTPQTSQTLPLEVPARVPHKKDDQDSTQPHRVESIKSLGDFSFSSSSTCDAILHRHRMSLQRNIAAEYDFFNGLLGDAVVLMDADLQDPPELVEQMLSRYCGLRRRRRPTRLSRRGVVVQASLRMVVLLLHACRDHRDLPADVQYRGNASTLCGRRRASDHRRL